MGCWLICLLKNIVNNTQSTALDNRGLILRSVKELSKMILKILLKNSCPDSILMAKTARTQDLKGTSVAGVAQW